MFTTILQILFLVIFFFTAVISLLSLPGWLTIEERYKRPLFFLVIIEVCGLVISVGANTFLGNKFPEIKVSEENWIALDLNEMSFFQPSISINISDTTIQKKIGKSYAEVHNILKNNLLIGEITDNGLNITTKNASYLGNISRSSLNDLQLFNSLDIEEKRSVAQRRISFERNNELWSTNQLFDDLPFTIKVLVGDNGTQYEIWKGSKLVYNSLNTRDPRTGSTSLALDRRENHIIQHNSKYYLVYVQHADLSKGYIYFSLIEFESRLDI